MRRDEQTLTATARSTRVWRVSKRWFAGGRWRNVPAGATEGADHDIAPLLVDLADLLDALLWAIQRGSGSDLDRRISAIVEIALDPRQGRDQPLVADRKAHPPARHRVGLRQ